MFGVDELGMDLGTSTLHIVVRGKGIVLSEPAYVAYDRQTRNVVATIVRIQGQEKLKTTEFIVVQQFLNIFSKNLRFAEEHNYTPLA